VARALRAATNARRGVEQLGRDASALRAAEEALAAEHAALRPLAMAHGATIGNRRKRIDAERRRAVADAVARMTAAVEHALAGWRRQEVS
jgi:hypothetical protein